MARQMAQSSQVSKVNDENIKEVIGFSDLYLTALIPSRIKEYGIWDLRTLFVLIIMSYTTLNLYREFDH